MEMLLEFIGELFFEGIIEVIKNEKVPKIFKLVASILFGFIYGGILFILINLVIEAFQTGQILYGIFFILVIFLLIISIIFCLKKIKK